MTQDALHCEQYSLRVKVNCLPSSSLQKSYHKQIYMTSFWSPYSHLSIKMMRMQFLSLQINTWIFSLSLFSILCYSQKIFFRLHNPHALDTKTQFKPVDVHTEECWMDDKFLSAVFSWTILDWFSQEFLGTPGNSEETPCVRHFVTCYDFSEALIIFQFKTRSPGGPKRPQVSLTAVCMYRPMAWGHLASVTITTREGVSHLEDT